MTSLSPDRATWFEECWTRMTARDASADGQFFYSVRTTGVYCRPSCAARRPNKRNVAFHLTAREAEQLGFRPCKRCRPDLTPAARAPRRSRRETIHFARSNSKLGHVLVAWSDKGVCAILMQDRAEALTEELGTLFPKANLIEDSSRKSDLAPVLRIVNDPRLASGLSLDVRGTPFQRRVWQALGAIPAGSTASYAEIARRIGAPRSVRAVARACASNVLAMAIPCHRVVRSDGALSGYRWGVERKRKLLESEALR